MVIAEGSGRGSSRGRRSGIERGVYRIGDHTGDDDAEDVHGDLEDREGGGGRIEHLGEGKALSPLHQKLHQQRETGSDCHAGDDNATQGRSHRQRVD